MVSDRIIRLSQQNDIIFVGPNGSGKSRTLRNLCQEKIEAGFGVISISNTPFSRLPNTERKNYRHIRLNPETTNELLKSLVSNSLDSESLSYYSMREILSYTGYREVLGVDISIEMLGANRTGTNLEINTAQGEDSKQHEDSLFIIREMNSIVGSHVIDLANIYDFFIKRELVARAIKNQRVINKILKNSGQRMRVSFTLFKIDETPVPLSAASSGELTLITLSMFILTRSKNINYIFIDEPENSLHPQWQNKFLDFISRISRREGIYYCIATHSPIILTGALSTERKIRVIRCKDGGYSEIRYFRKPGDESVEELLWHAFDVITPASGFVSKSISNLIWKLESGETTKENVIGVIKRFIEKSISDDQVSFLNDAISLTKSINMDK